MLLLIFFRNCSEKIFLEGGCISPNAPSNLSYTTGFPRIARNANDEANYLITDLQAFFHSCMKVSEKSAYDRLYTSYGAILSKY